MNPNTHSYRNDEGSVLLGVMGFLFLATGLVATILLVGSSHRKVAEEQFDMERAMDVAEAGMERGARYVQSNLVALSGSSGITTNSGNLGAGAYVYIISRSNSVYTVSSVGTVNSVSRTVTLKRIYQPTYAEFALWSSNNAALYFKSGEEFNGHVHADTELYFNAASGGPVFHKEVTSNYGTYSITGGNINDIELDMGLTLNSFQGSMADVDFNSSDSSSLKSVAQTSGLVLDGTSTITFNGTQVKITNSRKSWSNHSYTFGSNAIIYVENATSGSSDKSGIAYLQGGTVDGRLSVVTESDTYVRGNITYNSDPQSNPNSDDALGLISRDDVWVDTSAPNNLTIDAAIMATGASSPTDDGSFGVINYDSGNPRGTLNVYGGIVQQTRGAVGTFNSRSGSLQTGYDKNYSYDARFIDNPPPYYPVIANKVVFSQWQESK
ncbi:MAG TPA: hypothetical protein VL171_19105 [Verrucomicrobiae bacterium]|nr:hypothetical protein [Verrucomicrobiae bacterium]